MPKPKTPEKKMPYHENLPEWPNFAFPQNKTDGYLPSCRVTGWKEFVKHMQNPQEILSGGERIYRGQRDHRWRLSSTLSRALRQRRRNHSHEKDEKELLEQFKLAMRGRGTNLRPFNDKEIWALGQHNGLYTPLLDWTKSPFVALYFAFLDPGPNPTLKDEKFPNTSRVIFCIDMPRLRELMSDLFFEPVSNENARLVNQAGLFTITPSNGKDLDSYIIQLLVDRNVIDHIELKDELEDNNEGPFEPDEVAISLSEYMCKVHIPNRSNSDREKCLTMLREMNIHHGSLFPDLYGAAHYCNNWLDRPFVYRRNRKQIENIVKRSKLKSKHFIKMMNEGSSMHELINLSIRKYIDQNVISDDDIEELVEKIINYCNKYMIPYWPARSIVHYRIRYEIVKLIKRFGIISILEDDNSKVLDIVQDITAIFTADHRVNHYPGPKMKYKSKNRQRKR